MTEHAVCYTATAGYLFPTVVSAVQARANVGDEVDIVVCYLADSPSDEQDKFAAICARSGVDFVVAPIATIDGYHPVYARLFLDRVLRPGIRHVLYVDGDTQIVGDISPLVYATPPRGGAIAARDPMVFIRRADTGLKNKIDGWWDEGGIPLRVRRNYVNAGVLRIDRETLQPLRAAIRADRANATGKYHFADQDAINVALAGRLQVVSMAWNFPGFLLDTQLAGLAAPRIIHFMSNPRPWNAPLRPWGAAHHEPYRAFVDRHPEVHRYWPRLGAPELIRYKLQQEWKHWTERRSWESTESAQAVRELEEDCVPL